MRIFALVFTMLLSSCAASTPGRAPASTGLPWGLKPADLPDAEAVIRWSDPRYEDTHAPSPESLPHVEVSRGCQDKHLYPTHPQEYSKTYHVFRIAVYDAGTVPAKSHTCKVHSNSEKPYCLLADTYEYAVISDIFQDACGGLYRGFWNVGFLKQDDNMGYLLSKGRTIYPKPNSEFAGDVEEGQTYAVDQSDFLLLAAPFPGDKEAAAKLASQALATHDFDPHTHLFQKKP